MPLLSADKNNFIAETSSRYESLREKHFDSSKEKKYISYAEALANRFKPEWSKVRISKPVFTGTKYLKGFPLHEIRKYIDWTFFFHAWKLNGKFPAIFEDPVKGEEAKKLFDDANRMLDQVIGGKWLTANAVFGFFPASSYNDTVEVKLSEEEKISLEFLRNQEEKPADIPNLSLADFIAPKKIGKQDYIGVFVVTAGIGIEKYLKRFETDHDDYSAIMLKILADRLAEAFTELLHEKVRIENWGYSKDEKLDIQEMLKEQYRGIRPAPGYPACPDHSEKSKLFKIMGVEKNISVQLTENFAMYPAASVCGYYFAHPDSQYFNVGRILPDQLKDYADRKKEAPENLIKIFPNNIKD